MIDFWLGGEHHFPVDVAAARAFEQAYGPCAPVFRELRAFLGRAVRAMAAAGVDSFLVFGAGVPTMGNVHEVAPDATVLYTDVDPVTIRLGQRLLAGSDRAGYGYGDATDIGTVDRAQLHRFVPGWCSSAWPRSSTTRPSRAPSTSSTRRRRRAACWRSTSTPRSWPATRRPSR
ncbi:SAM-dependent methyltransferase [Micromonospora sp. NPDC023814]|uniref:SAM-dependent methyltransferase n=1 Tax=Micromonospora sp. NPDC023814 TaxID=3154596 RepID=UPI00340A359A